eukprot:771091-Pelagomonas_calceolata.AAC.4
MPARGACPAHHTAQHRAQDGAAGRAQKVRSRHILQRSLSQQICWRGKQEVHSHYAHNITYTLTTYLLEGETKGALTALCSQHVLTTYTLFAYLLEEHKRCAHSIAAGCLSKETQLAVCTWHIIGFFVYLEGKWGGSWNAQVRGPDCCLPVHPQQIKPGAESRCGLVKEWKAIVLLQQTKLHRGHSLPLAAELCTVLVLCWSATLCSAALCSAPLLLCPHMRCCSVLVFATTTWLTDSRLACLLILVRLRLEA